MPDETEIDALHRWIEDTKDRLRAARSVKEVDDIAKESAAGWTRAYNKGGELRTGAIHIRNLASYRRATLRHERAS